MAIFQENLGKLVRELTILDVIEAKDDGGGGCNRSYRTCKGPGKTTPSTYQHLTFDRPEAILVAQLPEDLSLSILMAIFPMNLG